MNTETKRMLKQGIQRMQHPASRPIRGARSWPWPHFSRHLILPQTHKLGMTDKKFKITETHHVAYHRIGRENRNTTLHSELKYHHFGQICSHLKIEKYIFNPTEIKCTKKIKCWLDDIYFYIWEQSNQKLQHAAHPKIRVTRSWPWPWPHLKVANILPWIPRV